MRTFGRIVVFLLLITVVWAVGYGIWDAGYDQGVIDGAEATEIVIADRYRGGFFPFGAIFGFFFLFLLFGMMFKFAFGWRRWGRHYKGYSSGEYRSHMEERMSKWHDKAHGRAPREETAEPPSPVS